jgi:hypothetical protein
MVIGMSGKSSKSDAARAAANLEAAAQVQFEQWPEYLLAHSIFRQRDPGRLRAEYLADDRHCRYTGSDLNGQPVCEWWECSARTVLLVHELTSLRSQLIPTAKAELQHTSAPSSYFLRRMHNRWCNTVEQAAAKMCYEHVKKAEGRLDELVKRCNVVEQTLLELEHEFFRAAG